MNPAVFYLVAALGCVLANAFFVAAEFALAKVRPTALEALARQGDPKAARALEITGRLDEVLSATQLGITLASLGLGWLGEVGVADLIAPLFEIMGLSESAVHTAAGAIAFTVISFLHIVVGELVPKSMALQRPEDISRYSAQPLKLFFLLSYPILWLLNGSSNLVLRALKLPAPQHAEGALSVEELRLLIRQALPNPGVDDTKRDLLERVLRATDRPVRAVMIPRVDMQILALADDFESCMKQVRTFGYSRYPVAEEANPDEIVGYIYVKDLLMAARRPKGRIRDLKRDILFVPESRSVGQLLSEFQSTKIPIALVVDEYGGTSGLVTLEDVVEELVGDIQDELHLAEPKIRTLADSTVVVDGSLPLAELCLEGLEAPPVEGAETVGGYLLARLGRLAHPGDRLRLGAFEAVVQDVRKRRVHRVALHPLGDSAPSSFPPKEY